MKYCHVIPILATVITNKAWFTQGQNRFFRAHHKPLDRFSYTSIWDNLIKVVGQFRLSPILLYIKA
jgi:hypothetical protein